MKISWRISNLTDLVGYIGILSTILSSTFQIIIIIFFLKGNLQKSPFKFLIILSSLYGLIFAIFEYLASPNTHSYNAGWVLFSHKPSTIFQLETHRYLIVTFAAFYAILIANIAIQFIFRYFAIFDPKKIKYFENWRLVFAIFYAHFCGFLWAFVIHKFAEIDNYVENYMSDEIYRIYNANISELPIYGVVEYDFRDTQNISIRWWNFWCTFGVTIIMIAQYFTITFCAITMKLLMNEKLSGFSPIVRKLHRQIFKALVLQIVLPTIVLILPLIYILILPFFNCRISFSMGPFLSGFTIYSTLDNVILFVVVSDFRHAVLNLVRQNPVQIHYSINQNV